MKSFLVIAAVVVGLVVACSGDRLAAPTAKRDLIGRWVGYDNSLPTFYSLSLHADNKAGLVLRYGDGSVESHFAEWHFSNGVLSVVTKALAKNVEDLSCFATNLEYKRMTLEISGSQTNNWHRSATLLNQRELLKRMSETASSGAAEK